MAATARSVRRLRLAAPSEEAARGFLRTLEDALRCASLPDEGARLIVVKRLALGRVPAGISSQALSGWIERRTAAVASAWVEGGSAGADAAACVAFASPLQARTRLAVRLLCAEPCAGWYWPLAVPEFEWHADAASNLRRIAWAIAAWPEAAAALPAWAAEVVRGAGAAPLAACIAPAEGRALLLRAGLAAPQPVAATGVGRELRVGDGGEDARRPRAVPPPSTNPEWLRVLLGAAAQAPLQRAQGFTAKSATSAVPPSPLPVRAGPHREGRPLPADSDQEGAAIAGVGGENGRAQGHPIDEDRLAPAAPNRVSRDAAGGARQQAARGFSADDADRSGGRECAGESFPVAPSLTAADAWLRPTACGGLLFLLPVLQRLGLPAWLPPQDGAFAALVLRDALQRLRVGEDDAAWQLVARDAMEGPPHGAPAPSSWSDPLLAPPRAGPGLAARLGSCRSTRQQAQVWLAAACWWLRRAGGIGLASLVLRPAHLALTATHADLFFDLAGTDLRVRRLGLDFDPGWLPWYGRVVAFHYEGRLR